VFGPPAGTHPHRHRWPAWVLRGAVSNARDTQPSEQDALTATQAELGRSRASRFTTSSDAAEKDVLGPFPEDVAA